LHPAAIRACGSTIPGASRCAALGIDIKPLSRKAGKYFGLTFVTGKAIGANADIFSGIRCFTRSVILARIGLAGVGKFITIGAGKSGAITVAGVAGHRVRANPVVLARRSSRTGIMLHNGKQLAANPGPGNQEGPCTDLAENRLRWRAIKSVLSTAANIPYKLTAHITNNNGRPVNSCCCRVAQFPYKCERNRLGRGRKFEITIGIHFTTANRATVPSNRIALVSDIAGLTRTFSDSAGVSNLACAVVLTNHVLAWVRRTSHPIAQEARFTGAFETADCICTTGLCVTVVFVIGAFVDIYTRFPITAIALITGALIELLNVFTGRIAIAFMGTGGALVFFVNTCAVVQVFTRNTIGTVVRCTIGTAEAGRMARFTGLAVQIEANAAITRVSTIVVGAISIRCTELRVRRTLIYILAGLGIFVRVPGITGATVIGNQVHTFALLARLRNTVVNVGVACFALVALFALALKIVDQINAVTVDAWGILAVVNIGFTVVT